MKLSLGRKREANRIRIPVPELLAGLIVRLIDLLERHSRMVRFFLRPLANAPGLRSILPVVVRAYMGASAFDCHVVDREKGWVNFGDVKETIHPGLFTRIVFETLVEEMGEKEGKEAIREIARESMYQEIKYGVEGKHLPGLAKPLVGVPGILDEVRARPELFKLVERGMNMVIRLMGDEGGWGRIRVSIGSDPLKVTVENTLDVRYLDPSPEPACVEYLGLVEGATSYITGQECQAREIECQAAGAPRCVFEVERVKPGEYGPVGPSPQSRILASRR